MVDRTELARRWAPTLNAGVTVSADQDLSTYLDRLKTRAEAFGAVRAAGTFVTDVNKKTIISAPATIEQAGRMPSLKEISDQHLMWMHGRFVGADRPNRNGALWSAGDLEMAQGSVTHGPLNWLHEERHVIGSITKAEFVPGVTQLSGLPTTQASVDPHITATAAIWRWIWPDEAYVIQQASEANKLWYSMECIAESVECAGESGCGLVTSYSDYLDGGACEHVRERSSVRRLNKPVFLGGAVIVPPVAPGWAEADAQIMAQAAPLAEAAFEQAGQPDVSASEWERLMGEVVRFATT